MATGADNRPDNDGLEAAVAELAAAVQAWRHAQEAAAARQLIAKLIPAADLGASLASGVVPVSFGAPIRRLRVILPTAGMALGIGWGRSITTTDYDDLARYVAEGQELDTPELRQIVVGEVAGTAATGPTIIIGKTW